MKIIREGDKIVAYRHWFKWYKSAYFACEFEIYDYTPPQEEKE